MSNKGEEGMEVMKDYVLDHITFFASSYNQICAYKEYQDNNVSIKDCILENKELFNKIDPEINDEVNVLPPPFGPVLTWSSIDVDDLQTFPFYSPYQSPSASLPPCPEN